MPDPRAALVSATRRLWRHRAFACGAAGVLALGIAAATALFALVDGVVMRPLPYPDPDRLVVLVEDGTSASAVDWPTSVARLAAFGDTSVFAGGLAATRTADAVLPGPAGAERLAGARATGNLFAVLGVAPQRGRLLGPADVRPNAPAVAVISDGLWRRRFGGDPAIVGRVATIDGLARTIVGVTPAGFAWPRADVDLWIPFLPTERESNRAWFALRTVGRLAPGLERAAAEERLRAVAQGLDAEHPDTDTGFRPRLVPLLDSVLGPTRRALGLLQAAVALVLLIAIANLANLLIARGAAREGELALRSALGADRWAGLRLQLGEGLAIGVLGSAVGLPLGALALRLAVSAAGESLPRAAEVRLDPAVVAAAVAAGLAGAVVASLVAALAGGRRAPAVALRRAGKGRTGSARQGVLGALVVIEVAAATALGIGGGLLARSLARVTAVDTGVDSRGVVTLEVLQPPGSELADAAAYFRRLLERARQTPGIGAVSALSRLPVVGSAASAGYELEGRPNPPGESPVADLRYVEPGAFGLLGIPLLAGRDVTAEDGPDTGLVILVNATFARRHFSAGDAVGKRLWWGNEEGNFRTIVGVVGDVHLAELELPVEPTIWAPVAQASFPGSLRSLAVVAKTPLAPADALARLRASIVGFDPLQAPARERTLAEAFAGALAPRRFQTGLFTAFAAVAALLAAVGVYAVLTWSVLAQRDEIAVRRALGSRTPAVLALVLGEALRLATAGVAIGAALAVAGNRIVAASLVALKPWDLGVLAGAATAALLAALVAAAVPALRAARTSPLRVLRGG